MELNWTVIFGRFFWFFVEAGAVQFNVNKYAEGPQGSFEGGATGLETCPPLSGSSVFTSEWMDIETPTGYGINITW